MDDKGLELAIELILWLEENNMESDHRCLMDDLADLVFDLGLIVNKAKGE